MPTPNVIPVTTASPVGQRWVLVVEDEPPVRRLLGRILENAGYAVGLAANAQAALALLRPDRLPDLVIADFHLPGLPGDELVRRIRLWRADQKVLYITADRDRLLRRCSPNQRYGRVIDKPFTKTEVLEAVAQLLRSGKTTAVAKPTASAISLLVADELNGNPEPSEVKRYTDDIDSAQQVIVRLALKIEARDEYTVGHCERLAFYATTLGEALNLNCDELRALQHGGYLHDLGKIGIPDAILAKPGPLTDAEMDMMRTHPIVGERLCGEFRALERVRPIVRHHHERFDGSGYPDGLRGDQIPLLAEITGLVDIFDALTTTRPYQTSLPIEGATDALQKQVASGLLRKDLVDVLLNLVHSNALAPGNMPALPDFTAPC